MEALQRAIDICGSQEKLGQKLDPPVKQQSVSGWLERKRIPPERAIQVETATDGQVTRQELCPDLYQ
ncbi:transcriptional regulator [Endozoicomonas euniceicola]|uniref:transcriptional regulator n=1 Tax=Endozoicomonas euniceicola TaxID=1234143 RepID=UPI00384FD2CE